MVFTFSVESEIWWELGIFFNGIKIWTKSNISTLILSDNNAEKWFN